MGITVILCNTVSRVSRVVEDKRVSAHLQNHVNHMRITLWQWKWPSKSKSWIHKCMNLRDKQQTWEQSNHLSLENWHLHPRQPAIKSNAQLLNFVNIYILLTTWNASLCPCSTAKISGVHPCSFCTFRSSPAIICSLMAPTSLLMAAWINGCCSVTDSSPPVPASNITSCDKPENVNEAVNRDSNKCLAIIIFKKQITIQREKMWYIIKWTMNEKSRRFEL